jgi:hypothetical protein
MNDEDDTRMQTQHESNYRERNWRNTMMTIADLASRAPSAYDLLYRMGLERRRTRTMRTAARAGWIGVGIALGGGLAMLFTPRSGPQVRERLGEQARRAREYVAPSDDEHDLGGRAASAASSGAPSARQTPTRRP